MKIMIFEIDGQIKSKLTINGVSTVIGETELFHVKPLAKAHKWKDGHIK